MGGQACCAQDGVLECRPRDRILEAKIEPLELEAASLEELDLLLLERPPRRGVSLPEATFGERDFHRLRNLFFGGADAVAFEDLVDRSHVP